MVTASRSGVITPPKTPVSIGQVTIAAVTYQVRPDPEYVRFFFDLMRRVGGFDAWSLDDLQRVPEGASQAQFLALAAELESQRVVSEVATIRAELVELSKTNVDTQVAEIRALAAEIARGDIEGQIAQIREQVAYMGGMKRKRVIASSITISPGSGLNTYTISPAVSSLDLCDLRFLGAVVTPGGAISDAQVSIELTNTSTVTAQRSGTSGTAKVNFQITEYTQ